MIRVYFTCNILQNIDVNMIYLLLYVVGIRWAWRNPGLSFKRRVRQYLYYCISTKLYLRSILESVIIYLIYFTLMSVLTKLI